MLTTMDRAPVAHLDAIDPSHFREVMGALPSGLTVVGGLASDRTALTVQSVMSLSLEPALIALGVSRTSQSWRRISASGRFSVNVLTESQYELARTLGRSGPDKLAGVDWEDHRGLVRIRGSHAWLECEVRDQHDGGDHLLVVAQVRSMELGAGEPLVFHRSRARTLSA